MFEANMPANRRQIRSSRAHRWLRHGVEDIAEPRYRESGLVKILPNLGQPKHRRTHPARQDVEGDQLADREIAIDDELGAEKAFVEASAEAGSEHLSSSTSNRPKPSQGVAAPAGSSMIGHLSGLQRNASSIRVNGKEADSGTKRTPVPETRPTTIEGWTVREVTNGIAALEGPNGILKVKRGDVVPGLGRIDSIVLWGQRWIVATRQGLISTP
jgi:hypothetical protein